MSPPEPAVRSLARRLVRLGSEGLAPASGPDAAERVIGTFSRTLGPLLGAGGFHLIVSRALNRARRQHSVLETVTSDPGGPRYLQGLGTAEAGDARAVDAAAEAVVAEVIELLARFLGADLAIRLVRQSFPEAGDGHPGTGTEDTSR
jgi:hypothetical protein